MNGRLLFISITPAMLLWHFDNLNSIARLRLLMLQVRWQKRDTLRLIASISN